MRRAPLFPPVPESTVYCEVCRRAVPVEKALRAPAAAECVREKPCPPIEKHPEPVKKLRKWHRR